MSEDHPLIAPPRFRPAGSILWAEFSISGPSFSFNNEHSDAQREGLRYEARVHAEMQRRFAPEAQGPLYAPAQWIRFAPVSGRARWAQPDGLILDMQRGHVIVVEIKLRHVVDAWWSLRHLYEPLVRKIFGQGWTYSCCEIVRWFDGTVQWPEPLTMLPNPSSTRVNEFGVHIWHDKDRVKVAA